MHRELRSNRTHMAGFSVTHAGLLANVCAGMSPYVRASVRLCCHVDAFIRLCTCPWT